MLPFFAIRSQNESREAPGARVRLAAFPRLLFGSLMQLHKHLRVILELSSVVEVRRIKMHKKISVVMLFSFSTMELKSS